MKSRPRRTSPPQPTRSARKPGWVYRFGDGAADGDRSMGELLGGKGANLAEMCRMGLPVPPGFTLSTEVCAYYYAHGRSYPRGLAQQVDAALAALERSLGKRFGATENPLLVSVRSGARVSMPGMMDTVLNLGLNDTTVEALARASGNARFAWDAYRRFVQMYADVVLGLKAVHADVSPFSAALDELKRERGVREDTQLTADDLRELVRRFKALVAEHGHSFPDDPREQLWGAIGAVFGSWMNDRAVAYREMHSIPSSWGTAVSVCAMVYGNLGDDSGTGVAFTRDPSNGAKRFYGEFLMNAQGEDVVAGLRTPLPIGELEQRDPRSWKELQRIQRLLEKHYRDMQDIEFTIERGRLFMLQCRSGKRTGLAAVRIAVDMARERLITRDEALLRVPAQALEHLLKPVFEARALDAARGDGRLLTKGLNAGPGAASGRIVLRADDAEDWARRGEQVILVRLETSPEDIRGMQAAQGILTARGGMTSHAALVARQMGKVCVAGAAELEIDLRERRVRVGATTLREGDWLSLDGTSGEVFQGRIDTQPSEVMQALFEGDAKARRGELWRAFEELMRWADQTRVLGVRANADQADQCKVAIAFGAEGIGLCRTEHMFFEGDKIDCVREMILADTREDREKALAKLLPLQRSDFESIFEEMAPHPCTIRTLDPPLHEFLPHSESAIEALATKLRISPEKLAHKVEALHELNPMLGHRGCRLGISYPEITAMQARALFEAACAVRRRRRKTVKPEIMIPLVATPKELELQARIVRETAEQVFREQGLRVPYLVGTMIELPRAAVVADQIAQHAEFFSFGTNDLTQTTFGISRDDGARFIPLYVSSEIFEADPFATLDVDGVGALMRIAVEKGRAARSDLKLGICGEHGGDPRSIAFCHELGLDYVSCSPHRLPIARLAAAQAALRAGTRRKLRRKAS
ncbi:MAG: pyruvate, phosphate dikinase [Planctomycetes bacterium]|nr:pyruvate, phosphate dikinase [Planctomycetota bacterium]